MMDFSKIAAAGEALANAASITEEGFKSIIEVLNDIDKHLEVLVFENHEALMKMLDEIERNTRYYSNEVYNR